MSQALVLDTNTHHFQMENVHVNGANQVQINNSDQRLNADQLDQMILQQLKALTQKIVDEAAIQQIQSSHSSEKHDAHGAHDQSGSSQTLGLASGAIGK